MILYRAINDTDLESLETYHDIGSSLVYTYLSEAKVGFKNKIKNLRIYLHRCFDEPRMCALDCIVAHISGKRLMCGKSPWISTTTDFNYAASEYSIPQSGNYNNDDKRKTIVIINMPNDRVFSNKEDIKKLRETKEEYFAIDLRNDNLEELFEYEAILPEYANPKLPGYDLLKTHKGKKVTGFSNFATVASEVLIYGEVLKNNIKAILSPELVDILYSCDIDIENNYDFIVDNYEELNKYLKELNNEFIGTDLTNCLIRNINSIPGNNIEEKYIFIKGLKRRFILEATKYINNKYNISLIFKRLIDDAVLVKEYENINNNTSIDDLVVFSKDNNIYKYDHSKKGYYCINNDDIITRTDLFNKINSKKRKKAL